MKRSFYLPVSFDESGTFAYVMVEFRVFFSALAYMRSVRGLADVSLDVDVHVCSYMPSCRSYYLSYFNRGYGIKFFFYD